ncbi:hypothetical protein C8R43DRAFT_1060176 [Mycena crocata]|nr:hypothetical protein C8R43DRAFT_1060176 [Mycena crocata]
MLTAVILSAAALYTTLLVAWHLLRRHLLNKNVGFGDLDRLNSRPRNKKIPGTAVICGGSVAGLLTARVCHDHFEKVLVIEAEAWVASEEGRKVRGWDQKMPRSRVLQYKSLHACQCFLFAGLQRMFPGFAEECAASDIQIAPAGLRFYLSGVPMGVPFKPIPETMYISRGGFETLLRRLVLDQESYPNIKFTAGTVTDVLPDPTSPKSLKSVVVRTESGVTESFPAALVADCTGPARVGMKWLERHGYGYSTAYPAGKLPLAQLKIAIDQKLRYTTIVFRISPAFHDRLPFPSKDYKDTKPIYVFLEDGPENGRGMFVLTRADGDQVVLFVGHHGGDIRPQPRTMAEVKEWVRGCKITQEIPGWIFEILDMLEEIEDQAVVSFLKPAPTSYIRYHQAVSIPSNFVALGDSVMTVNPTFGAGCTKAFRSALALHNVLRAAYNTSGTTVPADFSTKFFAETFDKTDWLWQNTRTSDYAFPTTEPAAGESLSSGKYLRWYIANLQRLALTDDDAAWAMFNSRMGLASSIDALYPRLVLKILGRGLLAACGWQKDTNSTS